jgi:GT2 family glycosyltransferase
MRTAAIVVTHNQVALARRCAGALRRELSKDAVCVVVNDASALDPTTEAALRDVASHVIVNETIMGYGANLNRGAAAVPESYDALLLLNDDAIPRPGAISRLEATLASDERAGLVGPRVIGHDGLDQHASFRFPNVASETATLAVLPTLLQRAAWRRFVLDERATGRRKVDWVLGAALLVRRCAFDEVGGFDESFFLYSEETDFARRLTGAGWPAWHCPDAVFDHFGAASTGESQVGDRLRGGSRGAYIGRHWPVHDRLLLLGVLPVVHLWNVFYSAFRALLQPTTARARWIHLREHSVAAPTVGAWPCRRSDGARPDRG